MMIKHHMKLQTIPMPPMSGTSLSLPAGLLEFSLICCSLVVRSTTLSFPNIQMLKNNESMFNDAGGMLISQGHDGVEGMRNLSDRHFDE